MPPLAHPFMLNALPAHKNTTDATARHPFMLNGLSSLLCWGVLMPHPRPCHASFAHLVRQIHGSNSPKRADRAACSLGCSLREPWVRMDAQGLRQQYVSPTLKNDNLNRLTRVRLAWQRGSE